MAWIDCKVNNDYEIFTEYPYDIRKKSNKRIIKEWHNDKGYIYVELNKVKYGKHRIVAMQFLPNDDTLNKTQVDHINHDRTDYHIENLRWVSPSQNNINKSSHLGFEYEFIEYGEDEEEEENLTQVTDYGVHEFEQYLYYYSPERNRFLIDTGINYRVLHVNFNKKDLAYVWVKSKENRKVKIYFTKFKRLYGFD